MTQNRKKILVLLVDDHKLVRTGIRFTLEQSNIREEIDRIDEAENGEMAVKMDFLSNYDLIFMDINMPFKDGIKTTAEIKNQNKNAKIIALSMINDQFEIRSMLKAGASGYLLKDTGSEVLEACVRKVLDGGNYFSNDVALTLMEPSNLDLMDADRLKPGSLKLKESGLTKRELEVLTLIAKEYTNEEISDKLSLSKRTVDSHRQNILRKTDAKNTAGLIKFAFRLGII
ncbi:MAG: response regulator transcription factor [Crocinitomicaceae bacterium]|nr:response regulator transcription factor [Crocinitomicaceae bacterium]